MQDLSPSEVWFEFVRVGGSVKVSAIHVASDTEIAIVCPASAQPPCAEGGGSA